MSGLGNTQWGSGVRGSGTGLPAAVVCEQVQPALCGVWVVLQYVKGSGRLSAECGDGRVPGSVPWARAAWLMCQLREWQRQSRVMLQKARCFCELRNTPFYTDKCSVSWLV